MRTLMRSLLPLLSALPGVAPAEDRAAPIGRPGLDASAPSLWRTTGRLGAYFANVSTANADTSRDPTIAGTAESTSYLLSYEGQANWKSDRDSIDNLVKARYGRIRTEGGSWQENNDEIRYDGVYRREVHHPHFVYLGCGAESVFTGSDPHNYAFDPTTGKVSGGYGQRYEDFLPDKNHCEGRVGARAQQSWGPSVENPDDDLETGIEAFLRYEHLLKRGDGEYDVRFFTQYEGFSEFEDLEHITHLVTAGLTMQLTRFLAVELGLRAFYETSPKGDDVVGVGYDEWSVRQDSLFGLTLSY